MNKTQIMSEKTFKSFKYMKISALNEQTENTKEQYVHATVQVNISILTEFVKC